MKFTVSASYLLLTICSLSGSTIGAHAAADNDCFNSTFAIIEAQLVNPSSEYIVCPNTTISVGFPSADFSGFVDGDWPLVPLGPNVTFKCGHEGKSSNNCVLDGSFIHFLSLPDLPQVGKTGIVTDNLYVSGFTFTGGKAIKHTRWAVYVVTLSTRFFTSESDHMCFSFFCKTLALLSEVCSVFLLLSTPPV